MARATLDRALTDRPAAEQVVTGATGRVGSLAVRRLLELYPRVLVRAVVNDYAKGTRLLKDEIDKYGIKLEVGARLSKKYMVVSNTEETLICEPRLGRRLRRFVPNLIQ